MPRCGQSRHPHTGMSALPIAVPARTLPCPCGATMRLKPSRYGLFYGCARWPACEYTHGAHADGTPLGTPADKATRAARIRAHAAFDQLWKPDRRARPYAYAWLRLTLGMTPEDTHIGKFDIHTCARVIAAVAARLERRSHGSA